MDIRSLISPVLNVFNYSTALLILVIYLLIKLTNWNSKRKNHLYWSKKNVKPGDLPSVIKVVLLKIRLDVLDQQLVKKYGKVFGVHLFGKPTLYCAEPELIVNILSKDFTIFPNRKEVQFNNEIFNNFLTRVKDEKWKRIRAIVSPTFSSGKLRKMKPLIDDCVQSLIADFNGLIKSANELDVKKVYGAFTMNVIIQVAFGTKIDALCGGENNSPIIVNAKKITNRQFSLLDVPRLIFLFAFPKLANYFRIQIFSGEDALNYFKGLTLKIIEDRKANKTGIKRYDFLQLFLDAMENEDEEHVNESEVKKLENDDLFEEQKFITHNKTMSIAEMTAQCVLFFVAGYETTATTISYCVYNLACNPEMQQILYEEAKSVLQSKTEIDYDLIHSLKYTDAVISETLRLFPPQRALDREAANDYILGDRIKISKGDIIQIPITALHKNAEYFPEPKKFKPERFFPENRTHHSYAYLPFGAGPRNCVAQRLALLEAKLALLYSVYNFRFSATNQTEHPPKIFPSGGFLVPRNVTLKVEKR